MDEPSTRCSECHREVDKFTAIAEKWGFWSDGCGELLPFCPECAGREFADYAPANREASIRPRILAGSHLRSHPTTDGLRPPPANHRGPHCS